LGEHHKGDRPPERLAEKRKERKLNLPHVSIALRKPLTKQKRASTSEEELIRGPWEDSCREKKKKKVSIFFTEAISRRAGG